MVYDNQLYYLLFLSTITIICYNKIWNCDFRQIKIIGHY
jgi:hypothetical protein